MKINGTLLRNRNFVTYWSGGVISALGDAMFLLALNWMIVENTGSAMVLGAVMACFSLPQILLVTVGGVVVDRFNPKWVMIVSDGVRGVVMLILLAVSFSGMPPVWTLFAAALVFGSMDALFLPAQSKFQQELVGSDEYSQAYGLLAIGFQLAAILGPVLGGALISKGSYQLVIAVNGISFLCSFLLLFLVTGGSAERNHEQQSKSSFASDALTGVQYVLKNRLILTTSISAFVVNACVQSAFIAVPFLAKQAHAGALGFGWMNMALGVGGTVAALFFALVRIGRPTPRMTFLACLVEGFAFFGLASRGGLWVLIGMMALIGSMEATVNTIAPSVNQKIIPPYLIGRVISFMIVLMSGSEPLARAVAGWVIQGSSVTVLLMGAGLLQVAVSVVGYFMPVIRDFSLGKERVPAE